MLLLLAVVACGGGAERDGPSDDKGADTGQNADTGGVDAEWARVAGAPADGLGNAITPAGDLDGDGAPDLLVAAYLGNRVCVLPAGMPGGQATLDSLRVACLVGEGDLDYLGYGLAGVGDVDGDGFDDVMVGAIGNGDAGSNAGKVYFVRGPLAPGSFALGNATSSWRGETAGDYAGVSLASAGDATGDGVEDYLVGASGFDAGATAGGRAYLLSGPLPEGDFSLADAPITFTGLGAPAGPPPPPHGAFGVGDFVGDGLLGPGDLDGDGFDDLVLGATGDATLGANTGRACVFRGPVGRGAWSITEADLVLQGLAAGSYSGSPLVGPGDLTGDGLADLLVAADGTGPGFVYLLAGSAAEGTTSLSTAITRFEGEAEGDLFGFAAAAADVTRDGVPDLLVGAPASNRSGALTGSAWLFEGPFAAGAIPTSSGRHFHGEAGAGSFGSAVALGPDMNLDGVPDLAVGEYTSAAGGGFSGALYLISP